MKLRTKKIKGLKDLEPIEVVNESNHFKEFCEQNDIIHEVTLPYSLKSNGIAERKNRTLKEMMNDMLVSSRLYSNMWGEVICHASNPILRFVTMTGMLVSSLYLILTRTNLTFSKTFTKAFLFLFIPVSLLK